jgi:glycosyltransferase involved in cell wall biosynthesis
MTTVGWLHHNPGGYVGGAELTMREFKLAAPDGVKVIDCPPGEIADCDRYVIGNEIGYNGRPQGIRYLHDMRGGQKDSDKLIFCSPLQREKYGLPGEVVPPALDLARFRPNRQTKRNTKRKGNVSIGAWHNPGKGQQLLREWSDENGLLEVWGEGEFIPYGSNIDYRGKLPHEQVAQTLWQYETFVHLPTALEPFGRAVVEAWAAGCGLVLNGNVGAQYYIQNDPEALETAAERFWRCVLDD